MATRARTTPGPQLWVQVLRAPSGEAPDWVRQAWVGLVLPLAPDHPRGPFDTCMGSGVLTGSPGLWRSLLLLMQRRLPRFCGYSVDSCRAFEVLTPEEPAAAAWWRENCPRFFRPGKEFLFDADACLLLDEERMPITPLPPMKL